MADTGKKPFDFTAAVAQAQRDYPVETGDTTFVDLTKQDAEQQIRDWYPPAHSKQDKAQIDAIAKEGVRKNGFFRVMNPPGKKLVAVSPKTKSKFLGSGDVGAEATFAFDHELGHAVVSHGFTTGDNPPLQELARAEIAADVFAILRGISNGTMTREQALHVSTARAVNTPGAHTTSQAVDAMLAENSDAQIRALSPARISEFAARYAALYMPKPGEIEALAKKLQWMRTEDFVPKAPPSEGLKAKLKNMFNKIAGVGPRSSKAARAQVVMVFLSEKEWLENVADVFNKAAKGSVASHVSEKILKAAFDGDVPGKTFDMSGPEWDAVKKNLANHNPHHNGP